MKEWRAIKASRTGPNISHLLFADDVLLFAEAADDQVDLIKQGFHSFCSASGQSVNFTKSHVYFSPNVPAEEAQRLSARLAIPSMETLGKYLGCHLTHKG